MWWTLWEHQLHPFHITHVQDISALDQNRHEDFWWWLLANMLTTPVSLAIFWLLINCDLPEMVSSVFETSKFGQWKPYIRLPQWILNIRLHLLRGVILETDESDSFFLHQHFQENNTFFCFLNKYVWKIFYYRQTADVIWWYTNSVLLRSCTLFEYGHHGLVGTEQHLSLIHILYAEQHFVN